MRYRINFGYFFYKFLINWKYLHTYNLTQIINLFLVFGNRDLNIYIFGFYKNPLNLGHFLWFYMLDDEIFCFVKIDSTNLSQGHLYLCANCKILLLQVFLYNVCLAQLNNNKIVCGRFLYFVICNFVNMNYELLTLSFWDNSCKNCCALWFVFLSSELLHHEGSGLILNINKKRYAS